MSTTTETKPAYSPGLAGVFAGETAICWVDPNAGLMYRGYDIHEMAQKANFEEVRVSAAQWRTAGCASSWRISRSEIASAARAAAASARHVAAAAEEHASDGYAADRRVDAGGVRSGAE